MADSKPFDCREAGEVRQASVLDDGLLVGGRLLSWLDMDDVAELDHGVRLGMFHGPPVVLTHFGPRYDELLVTLRAARGRTRRAALAQATTAPLDHYEARGGDGSVTDVLLFPHVVTIEPRSGPAVSVPLPLVTDVVRDGYAITLVQRVLPAVTLRGFGKRTDELLADLERARVALRAATARAYAQLDESLGGLDAPDGWALDQAAASHWWGVLRAAVCSGDRAPNAEVLAGLAGGRLRLGLFTEGGRFPMPFLLAPVGGKVAVEATGGEDRATFVFRTDDVDRLNAALVVTAFRRETLFLPDDQLGRWAVAVRMNPVVQWARGALCARVVHDEAWDANVKAALA